MKETFELVHFDGEESVTPRLYRRHYSTSLGWRLRYYAVFTDWQSKRRKFPVGKTLKPAIKKLYELDKLNDNEVDFDEQKQKRVARGMTFSKWIAEQKGSISQWHVKPLEEYFGNKSLTAIDDAAVQKYREKRSAEKVIRHGEESKKVLSATTCSISL